MSLLFIPSRSNPSPKMTKMSFFLMFLFVVLGSCSSKEDLLDLDELLSLEVHMLSENILLPIALSEASIKLLEPFEIKEAAEVDRVKSLLNHLIENEETDAPIESVVRVICQLYFADGSKKEMACHYGHVEIDGKFYKDSADILYLLKELRPKR